MSNPNLSVTTKHLTTTMGNTETTSIRWTVDGNLFKGYLHGAQTIQRIPLPDMCLGEKVQRKSKWRLFLDGSEGFLRFNILCSNPEQQSVRTKLKFNTTDCANNTCVGRSKVEDVVFDKDSGKISFKIMEIDSLKEKAKNGLQVSLDLAIFGQPTTTDTDAKQSVKPVKRPGPSENSVDPEVSSKRQRSKDTGSMYVWTTDGAEFFVSKDVLTEELSCHFEDVLESKLVVFMENEELQEGVHLDVDSTSFNEMLKCANENCISRNLTLSQLQEIMEAAKRYRIPQLERLCNESLKQLEEAEEDEGGESYTNDYSFYS